MYLLRPAREGSSDTGIKERERERERKNHVEDRTLTVRQLRVANVAPVMASKAI